MKKGEFDLGSMDRIGLGMNPYIPQWRNLINLDELTKKDVDKA